MTLIALMMTHFILAQAAPAASATGGDLMRTAEFLGLVIAPIVSAVIAWKVATRKQEKMQIYPQPLVIAMQKEFAAKHDFDRHVDENRKQHEQFDVRLGGVDRKGKERADEKIAAVELKREESSRRMHAEVNDLRVKVAQVETETKMQTAKLTRMDEKLDQLIQRT